MLRNVHAAFLPKLPHHVALAFNGLLLQVAAADEVGDGFPARRFQLLDCGARDQLGLVRRDHHALGNLVLGDVPDHPIRCH